MAARSNKPKPTPDRKTLNELLHLDEQTGRLYWKKRSKKWFAPSGYFTQ